MVNAQTWLDNNYSEWKRIGCDHLYIPHENLEGKLDLSDFINLKKLNCSSNKLTEIDISNNRKLTYIDCSDNQLVNLNLRENENLEELLCGKNHLIGLNISKNAKLIKVQCQSNQIIELELVNNMHLEMLDCQTNLLTNLDLTKNLQLIYLSCVGNKLTNLDLKSNEKLISLFCYSNKLSGMLDLSNNLNLLKLECFGNQLTILRINKGITNFNSFPLIYLIPRGEENFRIAIDEEWKKLVEKHEKNYPEMKIIDVSKLTALTTELNLEKLKDKEFLSKFISREAAMALEKAIPSLSLRIILDNLANWIVSYCLTVGNRLLMDRDKEYENKLEILASQWQKCGSMRPKKPEYYRERDKLVNEVLGGNKKLLEQINDLDYIKPEYKLKLRSNL